MTYLYPYLAYNTMYMRIVSYIINNNVTFMLHTQNTLSANIYLHISWLNYSFVFQTKVLKLKGKQKKKGVN